jgi:hypothetical protein
MQLTQAGVTRLLQLEEHLVKMARERERLASDRQQQAAAETALHEAVSIRSLGARVYVHNPASFVQFTYFAKTGSRQILMLV